MNDTVLQEHYDEFFEEVFTELEDKVSSVCCARKLLDVICCVYKKLRLMPHC